MTKQDANIPDLYSYSWVPSLDSATKRVILILTNTIIERTDTIGFYHPLSNQEGIKMLSYLDQEIRQGKKHLLLIKNSNNFLIGHALLTPNNLPNCCHRAEISRVMVHPSYRSLSLIKESMVQILKKCKEIGVSSLELDVRAHTSLSRLWRRLGFKIIGKNPDYVRVEGKIISGFYMRGSVEQLKKKLLTEKP